MAIVRLEGLGKLKKSNYLIGDRTRDLAACSIVPQPTMLFVLFRVQVAALRRADTTSKESYRLCTD
jgi:hypothetical protein